MAKTSKKAKKSVITSRAEEKSTPKNYRLFTEKAEVNSAPVCLNCEFCYIPLDSAMAPSNAVEFYCDEERKRPLSGDILVEPFEYYDGDAYQRQSEEWELWRAQNSVALNGTCDHFKRSGHKP